METAFKKLFNTQVLHDFYADGKSRNDLAAFPTEETSLIMKNNGMLFRSLNSSINVLYTTADNAGNPFVPFNNLNLVFALQLVNINEFLNFTDLSGYTPEKLLYFTNHKTPTSPLLNDLDFSLLDYLRPSSFTYVFPQTAASGSGQIVITNEGGDDVTPLYPDPLNVTPDPTGHFLYPIDFTSLPKGIYNFQTIVNAGSPITKKIYIDTDLARTGALGIVNIFVKDYSYFPSTVDAIRLYNLNFIRRESQWKYFVVLKSGKTILTDTIAINDTSSQPPYGPPLTFSRQADTKINNIDTAVFDSTQTDIPFFQESKKGLNIEKTMGTVTVVEDIAGPSLGVVSGSGTNINITEIFVFI